MYPMQQFFKREALGGLLLVMGAVTSLLIANSAMADRYEAFWQSEIGFHFGPWAYANTLHFWINHGLMTLFFLFVGLQIKKEILVGVLASRKRATLPLLCALGGLIVPAGIYLLINPPGTPNSAGWGIPIATDIAFVMGILMLLGNRVPMALKIFLMALAVFDDLGGILVLTFFYSTDVDWFNIAVGGALLMALVWMSFKDYRELPPYLILGGGLWLALLHSGVPPTIAGVLLAATIPSRPVTSPPLFIREGQETLLGVDTLHEDADDIVHHEVYHAGIEALALSCRRALSPLHHLETTLHPWVNFLILPLFALANASVHLKGGDIWTVYQHPVTWAIMAGLCLGKPVGISLCAILATRLNWATLPKGVRLKEVMAISFLGGISFTMSLFVSYLAFGETPALLNAKVGIFSATLISIALGCLFLHRVLPQQAPDDEEAYL